MHILNVLFGLPDYDYRFWVNIDDEGFLAVVIADTLMSAMLKFAHKGWRGHTFEINIDEYMFLSDSKYVYVL